MLGVILFGTLGIFLLISAGVDFTRSKQDIFRGIFCPLIALVFLLLSLSFVHREIPNGKPISLKKGIYMVRVIALVIHEGSDTEAYVGVLVLEEPFNPNLPQPPLYYKIPYKFFKQVDPPKFKAGEELFIEIDDSVRLKLIPSWK